MNSFLFKTTFVLNSVLHFWNLFMLKFLLHIYLSIFNVKFLFLSKNIHSVRCASAADVVSRDAEEFETKLVSFNQGLQS